MKESLNKSHSYCSSVRSLQIYNQICLYLPRFNTLYWGLLLVIWKVNLSFKINLTLSLENLSTCWRELWESHKQAVLGSFEGDRRQVELWEVPGWARWQACDAVVREGERLWCPSRHPEILPETLLLNTKHTPSTLQQQEELPSNNYFNMSNSIMA